MKIYFKIGSSVFPQKGKAVNKKHIIISVKQTNKWNEVWNGIQISEVYFNTFADFLSDWPGLCAILITILSLLMVLVTFPLSVLVTVKVVKEYERAVIFRLGRLLSGGARGPGIFFILPCVDSYSKVDMRTVTFDVPPQEVW